MDITVGTFNLNNLFSRYNFTAEVEIVRQGGIEVDGDVRFTFVEPVGYVFRTYTGKLVQPKPPAERKVIADRVKAINVDVLAVQEVEDIGVLRQFALDDLGGMYPYQVLVEGNDQRLIDVGLLSRYPIGAVTSWRFAVHPDEPHDYIFSRDLLEVEILEPKRRERIFTVFNTHLKSNYMRWDEDPTVAIPRIQARRRRQAESVAAIVAARTRPNSHYLVTGDMNDGADAESLAAFRAAGWVNGLARRKRRDRPNASSRQRTTRLILPGRIVTRSANRRRASSCTTKSGSARRWRASRWQPGSTGAKATPAMAATTIPHG
jgi:endonuclease/exonuclease/phosphatase family metal-dependent hydrolase